MVDTFLESGAADIEMRGAFGETPLMVAVTSNKANSAFIRHLVDRWGADLRACKDILRHAVVLSSSSCNTPCGADACNVTVSHMA
jgi:hypothetical protein